MSLPPRKALNTLQQIGDVFFREGPDSLEIFSLKPQLSRPEDDDPQELVMPPAGPDFDAPSPSRRTAAPWLAEEGPFAHWVTRVDGQVHNKAVRADDGTPDDAGRCGGTVGRAYCHGQLLAGKVNRRDRRCYVAFDGSVFDSSRYEVLVLERGRVEWVPCRNGYVPPSAMPAGITLLSNKVYCARVCITGILVPGQIIQGERCCRIPYDNHELLFREYEVLTLRAKGDDRPGPTQREGPTDQQWEDFVRPKSSRELDEYSAHFGEGFLTSSKLRFDSPSPDAIKGGESPNTPTSSKPCVVLAGQDIPGPSHLANSSRLETTGDEDWPGTFQPYVPLVLSESDSGESS